MVRQKSILDGTTVRIEAVLKINRMNASGIICLRFWLEVFKKYKTYILCDAPTDLLDNIKIDFPWIEIISSDRSVVYGCCNALKDSNRNLAAANLTGFELCKNTDAFWMIDADDTLFLARNTNKIADKLLAAEKIFNEKIFDAFSLDLYRNFENSWSFGVALVRSNLSYWKIQEVTKSDFEHENLENNINSAFHILGKRKIFKLGSFVFDKIAFQHLGNNYTQLPDGVYYWNDGCLWDSPLHSDVIII